MVKTTTKNHNEFQLKIKIGLFMKLVLNNNKKKVERGDV
jgi:hypothetical protein